MAVGDGWTSQLIAGLAQYLEDHGVGAWRPDGSAYAAGEIAIVDRSIPQTPDRLITIATYEVPTAPGLLDVTVGVQFRVRGTEDPRVCKDIDDSIFELLDGIGNIVLADIKVSQINFRSHVPLGQDANNRWESSSNFYLDAMRRGTNRTD